MSLWVTLLMQQICYSNMLQGVRRPGEVFLTYDFLGSVRADIIDYGRAPEIRSYGAPAYCLNS